MKADGFEASFGLLPETPAIFPEWKSLVIAAGTIGKQVHDARLVAVCQVHGITNLMTFNTAHSGRWWPFARTLFFSIPLRYEATAHDPIELVSMVKQMAR